MKRLLIGSALLVLIVFVGCVGVKVASAQNNYLTQEARTNDSNIAKAATWLAYSRNNLSDNTESIRYCREALKLAGAKLDTIGTTEEELHQLLIKGYLAEAKNFLNSVRDNLSNNSSNLRYCLAALEKAGAKPEAIGTSHEELCQLLYDGFIADARNWLGYMGSYADNGSSIRYLLESVALAESVAKLIKENKGCGIE